MTPRTPSKPVLNAPYGSKSDTAHSTVSGSQPSRKIPWRERSCRRRPVRSIPTETTRSPLNSVRTWLDEYEVGEEVRSPYFRLRSEEILTYARYTHDLRPILFNSPEAAARPMFVPPLYLLSLGMGLLVQSVERTYLPDKLIAFLSFEKVTFGGRAQVDDLIYTWAIVDAVDMDGPRGRLWYRQEVRNQDDTVLVANRHGMYVGRKQDES